MDYYHSSSTMRPVSGSDVLRGVFAKDFWYDTPSTTSSQQNVCFPSFPSSSSQPHSKCDEDFVIGHEVTIGGDCGKSEATNLKAEKVQEDEVMLIDDEPDIVFLGEFTPEQKKIESDLQVTPPPPAALSMPYFPQDLMMTSPEQIREPTFNLLECEPVKAKLGRPTKKKSLTTTTNNDEQGNWWVQLLNILTSRYSKLSSEEKAQIDRRTFRALVSRIELCLHECHQRGSGKYARQYLRLRFNLGDPKNRSFCRRVMLGLVTPEQLATMASDEMADELLVEWRKSQQQHSVELMVRAAKERALFDKKNIRVEEGDLFKDGGQDHQYNQGLGTTSMNSQQPDNPCSITRSVGGDGHTRSF